MSKKLRSSVPSNLNDAEIIITNASSDERILAAVGGVGYDSAKLAEGRVLLVDATAKKDARVARSGEQLAATAAANAARVLAEDAYQSYSTLARGEFKNSKQLLSVLGLDRPMPRSEAALIAAAKTLFENGMSNAEIKAAMLKYRYDDPKLAAESAKVLAFEKANTDQMAAVGAAQHATEEQDRAMTRLTDWVAQFRKAAKIALKNNKQLLEKLGIRARSTKTKAQRGAAAKAAVTRAAKKSTSK